LTVTLPLVPDESGLADLSVRVPLDGEALAGGISVYRRVDEAAGVPRAD